MKVKYLILGAGPAGLSFANRLLQMGETDLYVLEKEETAGGLCRSVMVDGFPLDIGGGHFLDVHRPLVNEFLFEFMPETEWNKYERDSRIAINNRLISHPLEANIWQMDIESQIEYLKSIASAGCNSNEEMPTEFIKWIYWKLGTKIANDYMIPYNQKMFGKELNQLGTYWLDKLPNVSFEETLRSCLNKQAYGTQPGHAQFYYPSKHGYGELWLRMADALGPRIAYNQKVKSLDCHAHTVETSDNILYQADVIVTTIPWTEFKQIIGMPEDLFRSVSYLKSTSVQIEYIPEHLNTTTHWIYCPNPSLSYHRILVRHNFCPGSNGYWTETNEERITQRSNKGVFKYLNEYAYPLNTVNKPYIMKKLLKWINKYHIYGLGRWGEHEHFNSDVTVERAITLAKHLAS